MHLIKDATNVTHKAHVEHTVNFIENDNVELFEAQAATFKVVFNTARSSDHDAWAGGDARGLACATPAEAADHHAILNAALTTGTQNRVVTMDYAQ